MTVQLLLAADDPDISRLLTRALSREGYDVDVHANPDAVGAGLTTQPDIIVLDAGTSHPGGGPGACWHLRNTGTTAPVLLLMDRTADIDHVVARDSGADDCLAKPFRFVELLARIHALLPHRSSIPCV